MPVRACGACCCATDDGERIFRLVWDTYPAQVDRVVVTVNDKTRSATENELHKAYGPRKVQPASGSSSGAVGLWVLVALLAAGGLITTVIVRRRRRKRTMPPSQPGPNYQP